MYRLIELIDKLNLRLFFFLIVPVSTLSISIYKYFIISDELDLDTVITLTFGELVFPYLKGAIWIFLYSTVRDNLLNKRTDGLKSSGLDFLFTYDERYMNFQNYQLFVLVAWLISIISQLSSI